jgi:hypothetical protein
MDRRAFTVGLAALAAGPRPAAAQDFGAIFDRLVDKVRLDDILCRLAEVAGEVYSARDAGFARHDWACFDDKGLFNTIFGDRLGDGELLMLVRLLDVDTSCRSANRISSSRFALPVGFVAYQALTRLAYIAAGGTDYNDAYVAFKKTDSKAALAEKLKAAQRAWQRYIEREGVGAVDRI